MECVSNLVIGEAPESEDDEEGYYKVNAEKLSVSKSTVVQGEAPESDDESQPSAPRPNPASLVCFPTVSAASTESKQPVSTHKYDSFLHKKLRGENESLFKNISDFVHRTFSSATKQLNLANQDLLQSQIQLQEAVTCLKLIANNSSMAKFKIDGLLSPEFLPRIKIDVPPAAQINAECLK